jgi:hypothetical protein
MGAETCNAGSWSACSIEPAAHDTCDPGNDDSCNGVANEGCGCINGTTGTCGDKLGAKGTCAAGTTSCAGGKWGACGVTPAAFDQCIIGNDDMCLGVAVSDVVGQRGFVMPNPPTSGLPNPAKYADNGDGTVTDKVTGLLWEQVPIPTATQCPGSGGCKVAEAAAYCQSKVGNWRLPTELELVSLVDYMTWNPAMDHTLFPASSATGTTWSSTTDYYGGANWVVAFYSGFTDYQMVPTTSAAVRCVSSTPAPGFVAKCYPQRYEVQSDGVLDVATGLVWQQQLGSGTYTLSAATAHCASLGTGWRVPSIKELLTTVDYTTSPVVPAIDTTVFPGVSLPTPFGPGADEFLSSSMLAQTPVDSWAVLYNAGETVLVTDARSQWQLRCVR